MEYAIYFETTEQVSEDSWKVHRNIIKVTDDMTLKEILSKVKPSIEKVNGEVIEIHIVS